MKTRSSGEPAYLLVEESRISHWRRVITERVHVYHQVATCGTYVKVRHLKVLRVVAEDDGDWHVEVTDGKTPVFITELIPADQKREGKPRVGVYIDETGTAYNDLAADGARHQYTTWEIHPITAWTRSKRQ